MNVVFLSPHFPPSWFRFAVGLREAGATVLGIADVAHESLRPELREALHDYYRVDDLHDYDQLVRAIGYFTHRHGRIDRLDSLNEHWLEAEAALRTDFNIRGINRRQIGAIKHKSLMKRRFVSAGFTPARGRICRSLSATRAFIREVGYPVVAKPDVGVGAAQTFRLGSDADVERYFRQKLPVDYIVEEFVVGEITTYDGLTDRNGDVVFDSSLTYSTGVMESVNQGLDLYYWIPRQIPADIVEAGRQLARAFDVRERPFHFELFRTLDGTLVPLEVNMRPPGGLTVDMFNYANDIDFYRQWARMITAGRFDAALTRPYCCAYVSRRDRRAYLRSHEDVLREFASLIVASARMDSVFAAAIGDHGYILRHPDMEPLLEAARAIQETAA